MINFGINRLYNIRRIEKRRDKAFERLLKRYSARDLDIVESAPIEIEVQKAYLQLENQENLQ